jgi:hypothetical protein
MGSVLAKFRILRQVLFKATVDDIEREWYNFRSIISEIHNLRTQAESYPETNWARYSQTIGYRFARIDGISREVERLIAQLKRNPNNAQIFSNLYHKLEEISNEIERIGLLARAARKLETQGGVVAISRQGGAIETTLNQLLSNAGSMIGRMKMMIGNYLPPQPQPTAQQQSPLEEEPEFKPVRSIPVSSTLSAGREAGEVLSDWAKVLSDFIKFLQQNYPNYSGAISSAQKAHHLTRQAAKHILAYQEGRINRLDPAVITVLQGLENILVGLEAFAKQKIPPQSRHDRVWYAELMIMRDDVKGVREAIKGILHSQPKSPIG